MTNEEEVPAADSSVQASAPVDDDDDAATVTGDDADKFTFATIVEVDDANVLLPENLNQDLAHL